MFKVLKIAALVVGVAAVAAGILLDAKNNGAFSQEREFTLKMNEKDLQVLDAAINKAPLPREQTQPFIERMQKQIVEQSKPQASPAVDANGNQAQPK